MSRPATLAVVTDSSAPTSMGVAGLPPSWTVRRPDPAVDVSLLHDVYAADDLEVLDATDASPAEVAECLSAPGSPPATDHWVVCDGDGRPVAWGYVDVEYGGTQQVLDAYVRPEAAGVRAGLLDRLVARARERAGAAPPDVRMGIITGDHRWEPLLRERGFVSRRRFSRMRVELPPAMAPPIPPPGVRVRTFDPASAEDWRDFHAVLFAAFRGHYGTQDASYEDWRARVASEEHRFDRWWLADDVGGSAPRPVAVCQGTVQFVDAGGGWVRNLGVLPEARGRGIARTLLRTAMAAFAADGMSWCGLGVDTGNETGALQLYESVGMRPVFQADDWRLAAPIRPGV
jgi:mycothiol synthase